MSAGRTVNSQSLDWGTPEKYIAAVKRFFGGKIDLDPCSNKYSIVQAEVEYRLPHTSVTRCLAVTFFTEASAIPASKVTRRPPCLTAKASK